MTKTDGKRLISLSTNEQISSEASKGLVEATPLPPLLLISYPPKFLFFLISYPPNFLISYPPIRA